MTANEKRDLPKEYTIVPEDREERLRAFIGIIDAELFRTVNRPVSFKKIIIHLYGMMDIHPQVKYYLGEKQQEHAELLHATFSRYAKAGLLEADRIDEGIAALITVATGYTLLNEYYDTDGVLKNIVDERTRIAKLMLADGVDIAVFDE